MPEKMSMFFIFKMRYFKLRNPRNYTFYNLKRKWQLRATIRLKERGHKEPIFYIHGND